MEIRTATDADWDAIWPIYEAIVVAGETYAFPEPRYDEARSLWMERPPGRTVVAVDAGRVLGSAKMGPNRPGRGDHVATASFMVDPAAHGRGVGRALGRHTVDWARAAGYRGMQFNAVVETNDGRRAPVAGARLRGPGHRARRVPAPRARVRRPARDVPGPHRPRGLSGPRQALGSAPPYRRSRRA